LRPHDADLLIDYEKLAAERAAKHQEISADHANSTRSAVERQQFVRGARLLDLRRIHRGERKQRHVSARIDQ